MTWPWQEDSLQGLFAGLGTSALAPNLSMNDERPPVVMRRMSEGGEPLQDESKPKSEITVGHLVNHGNTKT